MILRYLWPSLLWSLIMLVLTLMPSENLPDVDVVEIDKLVHVVLFFVLMIITSVGLIRYGAKINSFPSAVVISIVYCICFGILIEVLQLFVPGRSFSWLDMIANAIGVLLAFALISFSRKRKLV